MGVSLVNVIDPQTQVDTPVLSIFHKLITLLIFLELNVHHWLLRGLGKSFAYLPAGSIAWLETGGPALIRAAGSIGLAGLQMAAPVLLATVVADVTLGFLAKASPQLPVLFFGLSIKSVLSLLVMIAAVVFWPRMLERHFMDAIATGERFLQLAR
jgi:flagellar biosynthetic protein FliR